jgi:enterochelin esterase-like enzyme
MSHGLTRRADDLGRRGYVTWLLACLTLVLSCHSLVANAAGADPCCPITKELQYLLQPPAEVQFRYQVRHASFFSSCLDKEKDFFLILPPGFNPHASERYPLLILLHGYNFHRNGSREAACNSKAALDRSCQEEEEEYHWLLLEDIAPIAAAMMTAQNKTYQGLEDDLKARFGELALYEGLGAEDYKPADIASSLVEYNLLPEGHLRHPRRGLDAPFYSICPMIIVLPDGDNSFYTDQDEGKNLFPPTSNKGGCDVFSSGECLRISPLRGYYMKPGALGRYKGYILELMEYLRTKSFLKGKILPPPRTGIGGFSMGGFGALQIALRHPQLFSSVSSQSGLVDIELLTNKIVLKTMMPEFLEVFGHLEPLGLPWSSTVNEAYLKAHNPVRLIREGQGKKLWTRIYFDYGAREGFGPIQEGNGNLENALNVSSRMIPAQPYNGKAGHNYLFWRSRLGNVLEHHSQWFR